MKGEAFADVCFRIGGMQVNSKLVGSSCFGESVKGFFVAPELQERKAFVVVYSGIVWVEEKHILIGFKGFLKAFHLVVSVTFREPLLFCFLKEVRHTITRVDRVTSVRHRMVPRC